MPGRSKPMDEKDWANLSRHIHNQGIGELETKGLTEEEESNHIQKTFQEISDLGYDHIHTLEVIPGDGRKPYFVHRDNIRLG